MHPVAPAEARAFWSASLGAAERGERIVLGVWDESQQQLCATVTLQLAFPPNQPHRAEIAKMMTHPGSRGQGLARAHRRTHLMLDTASGGGAAGFYASLGYHCAGEIPDFALKPHGGLTGTLFFWKRLE